MLSRTFDLNFTPNYDPLKIHISQDETDFTLSFRAYSTPGELDLSGVDVALFEGVKSDGTTHTSNMVRASDTFSTVSESTKTLNDSKGTGVYRIHFIIGDKSLYSPLIFIIVD